MYKRLCIVGQVSQDYISADTFFKSWVVSWTPIIKLKLFASRVIEHANLTLGFTDKYKNILNQWKRISNFIMDFCGHRRDFREWRTPRARLTVSRSRTLIDWRLQASLPPEGCYNSSYNKKIKDVTISTAAVRVLFDAVGMSGCRQVKYYDKVFTRHFQSEVCTYLW